MLGGAGGPLLKQYKCSLQLNQYYSEHVKE